MRVSAPAVPTGIYGTIICAAALASASEASVGLVAVAVGSTLIVYWLAERYAELLGLAASSDPDEPTHEPGGKLTAKQVRHVLTSGWPMVQASITPLIVLLLSYLLGASTEVAIDLALIYTVVLLAFLGWLAATRARLTGWPRIAATAFTFLLGLFVVGLKASLH
jgi:hypothetical protein